MKSLIRLARTALSSSCAAQGGACHAEFCVDQQWDGSCCLHPLNRCQRFDSNYWECRTGSTFVSAE